MAAPSSIAFRPSRCRWCAAALSDLQRRRGERCDAAPCRHRSEEAAAAVQRARVLDTVREAGSARHGAALAAAPVVWLRHFEAPIAPLTDAERTGHADHLGALAAEPEAHARNPLHAYADDEDAKTPVDGVLCSLCRGRCCQHGVSNHGFVDIELLRRHRRRHGGTLDDAALHYLARLPDAHVQGSCVYHGERGCVLPRAERAPVCNGFACDSLRTARASVEGRAPSGLLIARVGHERLVGAAWLADLDAPALALPLPDDPA